ncbi:MAG: hypothetical protein LBQ46_12150 [Treponema sp.]|nr:hypothetical protein [Treponema sp.]
MSDNPWQSPETQAAAEEAAPQGILTALMIRYLKEASPWLRFIGVLGYIGAIFLVGSGLIMTIALLATGGADAGIGLAAVSTFMGLIYVVLGALAFFPARFTHGFGLKIRNYLASGAEKDLEDAFKSNKSLWKFSGIMAIVYLAFIPIGIGVAVIAAVSSIF